MACTDHNQHMAGPMRTAVEPGRPVCWERTLNCEHTEETLTEETALSDR